MLKLRPTFEQIEREARTHRLKILPERQKRTQQGILLDDVNFDDFDLSRYDRKEILMNNPDKGTQTDLFETKTSTEKKARVLNHQVMKLLKARKQKTNQYRNKNNKENSQKGKGESQ